MRQGIFTQKARDKYLLVQNVAAYAAHLRRSRMADRDPSKAALAEAQAQIARAKADVLSRKLVDVSEMERDAVAEWRTLRAGFLALPSRIAAQTVMDLETLALINQEVRAVLGEMAVEKYATCAPDRAPAEAV